MEFREIPKENIFPAGNIIYSKYSEIYVTDKKLHHYMPVPQPIMLLLARSLTLEDMISLSHTLQ